MSPDDGSAPRLAAVRALADVLDRGAMLTASEALGAGLGERDRALARHLAYGVCRWLTALEWLAGRLLERPLKRRDRDIHRLLLIGLHQLWRDEVPDHAAIHATAECARRLGRRWAVGLVNAVLRRFQRERETLLAALEGSPDRFAHPAWLLDALRADWPDRWRAVAEANNVPAALWLRVNRRRGDRAALRAELEAAGLEVGDHPHAPDALCIEPALPVERIPGFADGRLSVQDPAAQLAAEVLGARDGERILDACAAPGGKTCHVLERAPGARVTALDNQPARLERIRENLDRLGLDCALHAADAADTGAWWDGEPFDRVLLDAPCSATGVIRRHPEIKWLRSAAQVEAAAAEQARLLDALWPVLAPGGMLVYATCSVIQRENHQQIQGFLSRHGDASEAGPPPAWAGGDGPGWQIFPGQASMDGFYYARLRKHGGGAGADGLRG